MIEIYLSIVLLINIGISLFIAHKLNGDYPFGIRLLCMVPMLVSSFTLWNMLNGDYIAFASDIFMALGMMVPYFIMASRFTDKPILDMRN